MSKLVFVLLVFLLSLHACNARYLSVAADEKIDGISRVIAKDVLISRKLGGSFVHSEPTVVQTQEHSSTSTTGSADEFANTGKDSVAVIFKKDGKKGEIAISYSEETDQIQEWRQARSTMESSPNSVKETANSEDNDTLEDVVAMDYAKPHRKPPIHNRKL